MSRFPDMGRHQSVEHSIGLINPTQRDKEREKEGEIKREKERKKQI